MSNPVPISYRSSRAGELNRYNVSAESDLFPLDRKPTISIGVASSYHDLVLVDGRLLVPP